MYAWIWRRLPFGLPGKLIGSLLIVTGVFALLWYVVFPWAEPLLPFDDVQVESSVPADDPAGGSAGVDGESGDADDEHEIPYDTERNNTPPPSTTTR
ncbi:hypothetical protein [Micromonospora sp. HM5-17]|jgi:hypothetical protein|uniref:hypothetical protein n=1 Tax=Micromonospora sp. HM5-17 TaxID=2487710 RepID=UPI000F479E78|nr:hypothetical protein [Micromonospora sp. HM5-17]ROT33556.1 hypothetical protein EF879_00935 [Micromonospora sp. HM5-17]